MLSQETIQNVQNRVAIEEVIGDFVELKRRGTSLWACCPFHNEKTPSFSISPSKGFYKCFGCGASGDAIKFVKDIEGLHFVDAIKYLANKYNIEVKEGDPGKKHIEYHQEKESLYILLDIAKDYYKNNLKDNVLALNYLTIKRRFSNEIIKTFQLGYSKNLWDAFYKYAIEKDYKGEKITKSGLIIQKNKKFYDRFRGRIMFPIQNISGKVIAFGARLLIESSNQAKYINSPETEIYSKSSSLYGIFQAKQHIRQEDKCYLVEGYTDAISLYSAGIKNTIASLGTSLTEKQIHLVKRFTKNITIVFDGDIAGVNAALRGIDLIISKGMNVKIVSLPTGEDPDSLASKMDKTHFKDFICENEIDFISFKTALLVKSVSSDPIKKSKAIQEMVQTLSIIPDTIERTIFTRQCSEIIDIDENILIQEQNKLIEQRHKSATRHLEHKNQLNNAKGNDIISCDVKDLLESSIESYERESIRMLLLYGEINVDDQEPLYKYLIKELSDVNFQTPEYKAIWDEFKDKVNKKEAVGTTYFIKHNDIAIQKTAIDLLSKKHEISDGWQERYKIVTAKEEDDLHITAFKNVLRLKLRIIQKIIASNRDNLKNASDKEKETEYIEIHNSLKKSEAIIMQQLGIVVW